MIKFPRRWRQLQLQIIVPRMWKYQLMLWRENKFDKKGRSEERGTKKIKHTKEKT